MGVMSSKSRLDDGEKKSEKAGMEMENGEEEGGREMENEMKRREGSTVVRMGEKERIQVK